MSWRARLTSTLNELRIVYCPTTAASAGTREFVANEYAMLKALNPGLPIYVRPCDGASSHVAARYERGAYVKQATAGMKSNEVCAAVRRLAEAAPAPAPGGVGGTFRLADVV